ncbi:hypothetical protein SAMN05444487_10132 [Marininema mesophilum]|uniref:YtkA-like n=1 Tax=Marininema mesophilum TaxID=1048340 RepID=A0A1H2PZ66_9BACL|nr:hypothetical protein [Marininema mesophilum]SDW00152.1 hypothetical protein SAMN05444487_10132 [Marininema mesophilum]
MSKLRSFLPFMLAFALFFTFSAPALAEKNHEKGKKDAFLLDGVVKGKRTFQLNFTKKIKNAKGQYIIVFRKDPKVAPNPFYQHASKVNTTSKDYKHIAPKSFNPSPGVYEFIGEYQGILNGKKSLKGFVFKVKVDKNLKMKIIERTKYY